METKNKYRIGAEVYIFYKEKEKYEVKKAKISSINVGCKNKKITYKIKILDNDLCGSQYYNENELFTTKHLAELKLAEILNQLNFKIGDIVILNKEHRKTLKYGKNFVFYINGININTKYDFGEYDLQIIFCHNWSDKNDIPCGVTDKDLEKINVKYLKTLFDYKKLFEEITELENQFSIKRKELNELLNSIESKIGYNLNKYDSWKERVFDTQAYKNSKRLFGEYKDD